MPDITVKDYGVFSDAINTTNTYTSQIGTVETDTNACKTTLGDGGVLMGPFADECSQVFSSINANFSELKSVLQTISTQANNTSDSYQKSDKDAKDTVTDKETITTSKVAVNTTGLSPEIAAKKRAFVGDVDDDSQYTVREGNHHIWKNHMRLFDNTTGEEIPEDSKITLRKGETRVITVKLPTNTGKINTIVRTTAADTINKGDYYLDKPITTSHSDIDPSDNSEYVNYMGKPPHWPTNRNLLHNNYYDWVITADKVGTKEISTTCEYETDAFKGFYFKAMAGIDVTIVDDKKKEEES